MKSHSTSDNNEIKKKQKPKMDTSNEIDDTSPSANSPLKN